MSLLKKVKGSGMTSMTGRSVGAGRGLGRVGHAAWRREADEAYAKVVKDSAIDMRLRKRILDLSGETGNERVVWEVILSSRGLDFSRNEA